MSNPTNYTQYLKNPETKEAFLAGCHAMATIIKTSSSTDVTYLVSNLDDDTLLSMLLNQQNYNTEIQQHNAANIINHGNLNKSELRGMIFNTAALNDDGIAVNEYGEAIEDGEFRLLPGKVRRPWPHVLAQHKQTGAQITIEEYANLALEQQQNYNVLRYLDIKADEETVLKRIVEDNHTYMAELLRTSIDENSNAIVRYLIECGAGHGELPRGSLYDYRETVASAAREVGTITPMMAAQISKGYINSIGQLYLAWLQSLKVSLTPNVLCNMTAYQLAMLKLLVEISPDELSYDISDADIMYYRDVNGNGMKGVIFPNVSDEDGEEDVEWTVVPAHHPDCDIDAQKNYICGELIPKVTEAVIQVFAHTHETRFSNMNPASLCALTALIDSIKFNYYGDDCLGCTGCEGCEGDPDINDEDASEDGAELPTEPEESEQE